MQIVVDRKITHVTPMTVMEGEKKKKIKKTRLTPLQSLVTDW